MEESEAAGKAIAKANRFFFDNEKAIADYAQLSGFVFEPGDSWTLSMETGRGTYDPDFFLQRGYSVAECMWATCHEIEHFRDWRKDPEAYCQLYSRIREERRTGLLYHYLNDILANREVDRRFPAHRETRRYLYQIKLFPRVHYVKGPLHLQFLTAVIREKMVPSESIMVSPAVREAIDKLTNIDGRGMDIIDLVCDGTATPKDRFLVIRDYIEPVYERFFRDDVTARKKEKKAETARNLGATKEESIEGGSQSSVKGFVDDESGDDEDLFDGEYDEAEDNLPEAFRSDEVLAEMERETLRRQEELVSPEMMAKEQFRMRHGVTAEEVEDYAEEYRKIESQIGPLRDVFEGIIAERKEEKRRIKERTDQGVIIDPSMMTQAYIDALSGVHNSRTQLKVSKEERDEQKLKEFEITLICDLSGSMNENWPGGKSYEQRLSAILITEALDEFEKKLRDERTDGSVDLHLFSEVRGFHGEDEELKPISDSITFASRVRIFNRLEDCIGNSTADYKSLAHMVRTVHTGTERKIREGELKKVVLLITDGGSDDISLAKEAKEALNQKGVITKAIQVGKPDKEEVGRFRYVWHKDGAPCKNVHLLVPTIETLLFEFLKNL